MEATDITGKPVKIFDPFSAALAVFIGAPLAGGWILRKNFMQLGRKKQARRWFYLSVFFSAAIVAFAFIIPDDVPNSATLALNTAICGVYASLVHRFFGDEIESRKAQKSGFYSRWRAVPPGLVSCVIVLGVIFLAAVAIDEIKYNSPGDREIKEKIGELFSHLEQTEDISRQHEQAVVGIVYYGTENNPETDFSQLESMNRDNWAKAAELIGEIEILARANSRQGIAKYMETIKPVPGMETEKISLYPLLFTEDRDTAAERLGQINSSLNAIFDQLDLYMESIDDAHQDILYLLP